MSKRRRPALPDVDPLVIFRAAVFAGAGYTCQGTGCRAVHAPYIRD